MQQAHPPSQVWVEALAQLLEGLGTATFAATLRRLLGLCCDFESMVVSRYEGTRPPVGLYQDLDELQAAISVEFYASGPYLLDPLYQACRNRVEPGAYRLMDLVPEGFFRSQYYQAFYRKINISDEIGLLVQEDAESWIIVSLGRFARQPKFSPQDAAHLNAVFAMLSAAILRQWGERPVAGENAVAADWDIRMQTFGNGCLSPREMEIIQLILQGHSTPSAAAYLGIAPGTVKVHRHHAYAKLGIASQAELFSMATRHLSGG